MSQFENFTDGELINELESRGYVTELLFNREDVQMHLDSVNEDRENDDLPPVEMDDDEKDYILESIEFDWYIQQINESIFDKVHGYFVGHDDEDEEDEDE